jgi:hypothetical protein
MSIAWEGKAGKYLEDCGFHAFEFGVHKDGCVDVSTQDSEVVSKVTKEQADQIIQYLKRLEIKVMRHIDLHYSSGPPSHPRRSEL